MAESKLHIKGMVCQRCMLVIGDELQAMGYPPVKVNLGEVTVITTKDGVDMCRVKERLSALGFGLLEDKKVKTVREVKQLVEEVYGGDYDFPSSFRFSDVVRQRISSDYEAVSSLFSLLEHQSIEKYVTAYRIGKVKEFLARTSMTLGDIAFRLNYNSVPHLSAQFRQHTGLTPSHFRTQESGRRNWELGDACGPLSVDCPKKFHPRGDGILLI
jgi:AraC family transcriptional regulator